MRKFTFTGSTEVGKQLMAQCASTVKKVSLELGGNAPFIVFDDADLDAAVEGAMASKFRNTGQTCVCANRIFVQDGVYDAFAQQARRQGRQHESRQRPGGRRGAGPLIDMKAVEKVEEHIADALAKGARVVTGGKRHEKGGAVLPADGARRRDARHEGHARRNLRPGGAALPLQDRGGAARARERYRVRPRRLLLQPRHRPHLARRRRLESGIVGINVGIISTEVAPFGGVKESGIGREGSKYGIEEFLEVKYLCMGDITKCSTVTRTHQ